MLGRRLSCHAVSLLFRLTCAIWGALYVVYIANWATVRSEAVSWISHVGVLTLGICLLLFYAQNFKKR